MHSNNTHRLRNRPNSKSRREALALALVNAPTVCDERFFNDDIADLPVEALLRERYHLRLGLSLATTMLPWGKDRLARIERELRVRCAH